MHGFDANISMKSNPVVYRLMYCILFTCFLPIKASRIGESLLLFAPSFSNPSDWKACSTDLDCIGKCNYGSWVFSITFISRLEDKIWVQSMKDVHMKVQREEKNCLALVLGPFVNKKGRMKDLGGFDCPEASLIFCSSPSTVPPRLFCPQNRWVPIIEYPAIT